MIKLIRLEMAKYNLLKWSSYAALCLVFSISLVLLLGFADVEERSTNSITLVEIAKTMIGMTFLIFSSVMHSAFTVNEYKAKTVSLLFSYPIKRKKILTAKIVVVLSFNFIAILIGHCILYFFIDLLSRFYSPLYPSGYDLTSVPFLVSLLVSVLSTVSMSMIALFIGMLNKSPIATVVSSFMLVALMGSNFGGSPLQGFIQTLIMPILFTGISVVFAVIMISGVEKRDIL